MRSVHLLRHMISLISIPLLCLAVTPPMRSKWQVKRWYRNGEKLYLLNGFPLSSKKRTGSSTSLASLTFLYFLMAWKASSSVPFRYGNNRVCLWLFSFHPWKVIEILHAWSKTFLTKGCLNLPLCCYRSHLVEACRWAQATKLLCDGHDKSRSAISENSLMRFAVIGILVSSFISLSFLMLDRVALMSGWNVRSSGFIWISGWDFRADTAHPMYLALYSCMCISATSCSAVSTVGMFGVSNFSINSSKYLWWALCCCLIIFERGGAFSLFMFSWSLSS